MRWLIVAEGKETIYRIAPVWQGAYKSTKQYSQLDIVSYNGARYIALNSTKGNVPTDTNHWLQLATVGSYTPTLDSNGILS